MKLWLFWGVVSFWGATAGASTMQFEYRSHLDPFPVSRCAHSPSASGGGYDWEVLCPTERGERRFVVHLALSRYPKTVFGGEGYELLYWVTDWQDAFHPLEHSTTVWIHNRGGDKALAALEATVGIDNGQGELHLLLDERSRGAQR